MPEQPSSTGIVIGGALSVLILFLWLLQLAFLVSLGHSDAAGNALGEAFAAIEIGVLWLAIAILALIAFFKGNMSRLGAVAALILIPLSFVVSQLAADLLGRPYEPPGYWPIIIPALIPPIVVAFCFWAMVPAWRAKLPAPRAAGLGWGAVLVLCAAIWPLGAMREKARDDFAAGRAKYAEDFAKVPAGAPLWEWTPFLDTPDQTRVGAVLDRITALDRRQGDAEVMLERGDFPLGALGRFDLTPTPSICDKARALLRKQAAALVPAKPNTKPYSEIGMPVGDAVAAMNWLVGYDCSCDAESLAWEAVTNDYKDPGFDQVRLRELRDPKELGRIVRRNPSRFSMLNEKSHLKAWLKFADEKAQREAALAGARKLDHRTDDAVEMLQDKYDIAAPWTALRYLPVLGLEATPMLCGAALTEIRGEMAKIHRPKADDPRPYSELLARLGNDAAQLPALRWLGSHGCEAGPALIEAEAMIVTYQDSPARAAMLESLAQLRGK